MLTYAELSKITRTPRSTVRDWIASGVCVGSPGYERVVFLEGRTITDLFAFIRDAATHPSLRYVPHSLIVAAFGGAPRPEIPRRFQVPPVPQC